MNNNRRKNRGGSTRNSRMRLPVEGVYSNTNFMHTSTALVGNIVQIYTGSGGVWEGVFLTFSSNFDVVLEMATRVDNPDTNPTLNTRSLTHKLIFRSTDIIDMVARNVDLDFATRDTFQTDTAISARLNGQSKRAEEKELEPWDAATFGINGADINLELEPGANGWNADDMFRKNEQKYGVQSTYDSNLTQYTVQLQSTDSAEFREAEMKAEQIASEIENHPSYKARMDLENGDEEELFAAVHRPTNDSKSSSENSSSGGGKYVPPAKRKNPAAGKLMRSTPPPSQSSSAQTTPSPKGPGPQMTYPTQQQQQNNMPPPQQTHPQQQQQQQREPPMMQHAPPPQQAPQMPPPNHGGPIGGPPQNHGGPMVGPPQNAPMSMVQHNHQGRPTHSHTPPHAYGQMQQQQRGPPVSHNGKGQMNGEVKQNQRPPRNVYSNNNNGGPPMMQQVPQQGPPQQYQEQGPKVDVPRHREEAKELHKFAQDFKLVNHPPEHLIPPPHLCEVTMAAPPPAVVQGPPLPKPQQHPGPQTSPPQQQLIPPPNQQVQQQQQLPKPQQSISPQQQDAIDKVTNTVQKSTLNPLAKEFVLNPTAKPFTPRTPTVSRPHTPQTPSNNPYMQQAIGGPGQLQMPIIAPMGYMVPANQPQYQQQTQSRFRKVPMSQIRADMASQMQVAAATGQPLLAPAPMQPYPIYQPGINPQGYQTIPTLRMYDQPPQLPYLQSNPSNAPSPAQHPQYTQGQGPQQPPQQYQPGPPHQGHPQFQMMCPIIPTQQHVMQAASMHYLNQPPPGGPIQVIVHPQQQHGPAP